MPLRLTEIPNAIRRSTAAVVVDWNRVDRALTELGETDLDAAYGSLALEWLGMIRDEWGGDFRLYESTNFLVLSARPERFSTSLLRLGEQTYSRMTETLPSLARKDGFGKFVCIVADSLDRYYDYVDTLCGDSSLPITSGVFLKVSGYAHFLLNHGEHFDQEATFVHELTHALINHLAIPLWVEEGITQIMEEDVLGFSSFDMNREEAMRHRDFWSTHGLTDFWFGASFGRSDDGQELSYVLSQIFVRHMLSRGREEFVRFVEHAKVSDCGEAASREVYGLGLVIWAGAFLGEGEWSARVETAEDFFARAHSLLREGELERARADLARAVELEPSEPNGLNELAWLLATHPEPSIRNGAAAVRLALEGCERTRFEDEIILDTLAAAYAEAGDYARAVEFQKRAIALAPEAAVEEEKLRLALYERGEPYREEQSGA